LKHTHLAQYLHHLPRQLTAHRSYCQRRNEMNSKTRLQFKFFLLIDRTIKVLPHTVRARRVDKLADQAASGRLGLGGRGQRLRGRRRGGGLDTVDPLALGVAVALGVLAARGGADSCKCRSKASFVLSD
jgi:hypothetical protein